MFHLLPQPVNTKPDQIIFMVLEPICFKDEKDASHKALGCILTLEEKINKRSNLINIFSFPFFF